MDDLTAEEKAQIEQIIDEIFGGDRSAANNYATETHRAIMFYEGLNYDALKGAAGCLNANADFQSEDKQKEAAKALRDIADEMDAGKYVSLITVACGKKESKFLSVGLLPAVMAAGLLALYGVNEGLQIAKAQHESEDEPKN